MPTWRDVNKILLAENVAMVMFRRGWQLYGYWPQAAPGDRWCGIASHPGMSDHLVGVWVSQDAVERYSGRHLPGKQGMSDDKIPVFQATPKGRGWHIERDGELLRTGTIPRACYTLANEATLEKLVDRLEALLLGKEAEFGKRFQEINGQVVRHKLAKLLDQHCHVLHVQSWQLITESVFIVTLDVSNFYRDGLTLVDFMQRVFDLLETDPNIRRSMPLNEPFLLGQATNGQLVAAIWLQIQP